MCTYFVRCCVVVTACLLVTEIVTTVLPTLAPSTATTAVAQTTSARTPSSPSTPSSPLSEHSRKPLHVSVKTTTESVKPGLPIKPFCCSIASWINFTVAYSTAHIVGVLLRVCLVCHSTRLLMKLVKEYVLDKAIRSTSRN